MSFSNSNQLTGRLGEEKALSFLQNSGYKILDRNVRIRKFGEIDIIAEENGQLVFIEVKNRNSLTFGFPQESIIRKKQQRMVRLALMYIKKRNLKLKNVRFDVLAIFQLKCELIKNAFNPDNFYKY